MVHCFYAFVVLDVRKIDIGNIKLIFIISKAQVLKTLVGALGYEFGRPIAYFEFPKNQAGKIGGCQAEAHIRVINACWPPLRLPHPCRRLAAPCSIAQSPPLQTPSGRVPSERPQTP